MVRTIDIQMTAEPLDVAYTYLRQKLIKPRELLDRKCRLARDSVFHLVGLGRFVVS